MKQTTWRVLGTKGKVFSEEQAASDTAALHAIHAKQVERYGKEVVGDFPPDLTSKPILNCMVAERDGEIVDGVYAEATVEWCMVGCDSRATASLRRAARVLIQWMQGRGFRFSRIVVPHEIKKAAGKELDKVGYKPQNEMYETYLLDMRARAGHQESESQ